MITQIVINERNDFKMFNTWDGDVEPFHSILISKIFSIKAMNEYMTFLSLDESLLVKKQHLRNYIEQYWNSLPYHKYMITNTIFMHEHEFMYNINNQ